VRSEISVQSGLAVKKKKKKTEAKRVEGLTQKKIKNEIK
jgi:hypothetical protein